MYTTAATEEPSKIALARPNVSWAMAEMRGAYLHYQPGKPAYSTAADSAERKSLQT